MLPSAGSKWEPSRGDGRGFGFGSKDKVGQGFLRVLMDADNE